MAVTQQQFDALIARLELLARKQPALYKLRVGALAAVGYAYIFAVVALLLAILLLLVLAVFWSGRINFYVIKFGFLLLVPTFIILRSLWVSFPPPAGLELRRQEVPRLFALVDELAKQLRSPANYRILLTEDFNAGIVQRPRLGIFGWQQNYLILGLPLLQALSPEQLRAVLAHELGHLSGNHSRFAGWIYRVRQTYYQILERLLQSQHQGSAVLFVNFFNWYAPFFNAYSFVLARMNEYEADRCSAELAGAQNTAAALVNVEIKARFLDQSFWPAIYQTVNHQVEPPASTFTNLSGAFAAGGNGEEAAQWLEQAIAQKTSNADTHPCLRDRLSALGFFPANLPKPEAIETSAAEAFLGEALPKLTAYFDRVWVQKVATPWRQRYAYATETQNKLRSLEDKAQHGQLTAEEAWNRAAWTAEFKGNEAALPLLQEILAAQPQHASANYLFGQILLEQNDEAGIGYVDKAIAQDEDKLFPGCELIYLFLKERGKVEEAKVYQQRSFQHYEQVMLANQERSYVADSDKFIPHDLPAEAVHLLCKQLARYQSVTETFLVKKVVKYFPEKPLFVLGITVRRTWYKLEVSDQDAALLKKIYEELQFPGEIYIFLVNYLGDESGYNQKIGKILRRVEGAVIYRK